MSAAAKIMQALYGHNIWEGFKPIPTTDVAEGWNGTHSSLSRLVKTGSKIAIDVGVWKGQSTITLASALKESQFDGCVIAVDTFLGSLEHWSANERFRRTYGMPDIFMTFMSNVWKAGVQDYVVPMPQTSLTAAIVLERAGIKAAVVHVDAAHEYEDVLRDARNYWKLLEPGGFMIGDDYHATWPGVVQAAGEFSASLRLPLVIEEPKWILRKP